MPGSKLYHIKLLLPLCLFPFFSYGQGAVEKVYLDADTDLRTYIFLSVYAGLCILATFYWLINFFFSRRLNYLYLIVATLSVLFFCLDIYGVTLLMWPGDPWHYLVVYGQHYVWLPLMVSSHFAISYSANSFVVHFNKSAIICYWGLCFSTIFFLWVGPFLLPWASAHAISMWLILLCMTLGVIMITFLLVKRGFRSTGFAFLAIVPLFAGVAMYFFISFGFLQERYMIATPIGGLATVVMYFYGMVHYVRILRKKRKEEMVKNDVLIRKQNVLLEKTVEERTQELKQANSELSNALIELRATHQQLLETEKLKADEKINRLMKEQELKSVNHMLQVQEDERRRIGSELHDRLGSMLSTVKLYFGCMEEQIDMSADSNKEQYSKAVVLLDEACEEVRKISHDLVSGELVKFGLTSALRQLAETIRGTGQVWVNVQANEPEERVDSLIEIELYRVVQELLNNVLKHSQAGEVNIQLNRNDGELYILVADNGKGFNIAEAADRGGMGIRNMHSRINKLSGKIAFESGKGKGTTVAIHVPV